MSVVDCDTEMVLLPHPYLGSAGVEFLPTNVARQGPQLPSAPELSPVVLRCFGRFELWMCGTLLPLDGLRPQQLSLLRLLSINAGSSLHEESLMEHFWPDKSARSAKHSLHVAISAIRRVLDSLPESQRLVRLNRRGDGYFLELPPGSWVDVSRFARVVRRIASVQVNGSRGVDIADLRDALRLYRGDLLVEEGPSTWVVAERMRLQVQAARAATALAEAELWRDELPATVDTCLRGLSIDRYHDPLWRVLITAYDRSGDMASSYRARRDYARVLAELGAAVTGLSEGKAGRSAR